MSPRRWLATAAVGVSLALGGSALAADPPPKRAIPDYDGRGKKDEQSAALWAPRILASPLYLTSEYVIRRPMGWLVTTAEREHWPAAILDFFTFGPERKAGVIPTALFDFGFKPSVGLYIFWDDAVVKDNAVRVHAATWGADWLVGSLADRFPIGKDSSLALRVDGVRRKDLFFHGIGARTLSSAVSRYSSDNIDLNALYTMRLWRSSLLSATVGGRAVEFADRGCCEDPTLGQRVRAGAFPMPPGFEEGYSIGYQRLDLAIDSRRRRPAEGTGVRVELEGEQAVDPRAASDQHWFRYGGTLGGFLDLNNRWRVLSFAVTALFVDPLRASGTVPFTEHIVLGGSGPMRGYVFGRLRDRSAAVATLQYQWPIWVWLDGTMQLAVGNVFGEHLSNFSPDLCRLSWSLGLRTVGSPDHSFEILGGFGTETFRDGASITSARIVVGATKGF